MSILGLLKWIKKHPVTVTLVAVSAFVILVGNVADALNKIYSFYFGNEEKTLVNIELVIDRSDGMGAPFGHSTKLKSVIKNIGEVFKKEIANNDNLSLRQFGGACDDDNTQLLIPFSTNNKKAVSSKLEKIYPHGKRTIVNAVIEGTGDFNDVKKFSGTYKSIIVFTGGIDSCYQNAEEILEKRFKVYSAKNEQINISYRYFGIALTQDEKAHYLKIADKTGGMVSFVKNEEELKSELTQAIRDIKKGKYVYKNLLLNPGFENGLTGWKIGTSEMEQFIDLSPYLKLIDKDQIQCKFNIDIAGDFNATAEALIQYRLDNGSLVLETSSGQIGVSAIWNGIELSTQVPQGVRNAVVIIRNNSINGHDNPVITLDNSYFGCGLPLLYNGQ